MLTRRHPAAAALALALMAPLVPWDGLSAPASAAPAASVEDGFATGVRVTAPGREWVLQLLASRPRTGGPARLRVALTSGTSERRLYAELPAAALTTDATGTTLRARLGALPLVVRWRTDTYVLAASFGRLTDDDRGSAGWFITGNGATPTVTLGSARCSPVGSGVVGTAVAYEDQGYGDPLASGLALPSRGLACLPRPNESPLP